MVQKNSFAPAPQKGTVVQQNLLSAYQTFFEKQFSSFPFKIVIDTANSVGLFEAQVLQKHCATVPLFFELDGRFPNHLGNPLDSGTLSVLQKTVVQEKADLGIAFDGDADRVSFIDEKGQVVPNDLIAALLVRFFSRETILFDVRSTQQIEKSVLQAKGKPLRCRVGHAFIKQQMRDSNAAFAAELSGHYYYRDLFFAECLCPFFNIIG